MNKKKSSKDDDPDRTNRSSPISLDISGLSRTRPSFSIPINDIIKNYETLVFSLAVNLTGSSDEATRVVEDVFIRLERESAILEDNDLENVLHRFTYDRSLDSLLGSCQESSSGQTGDDQEEETKVSGDKQDTAA